jgi:hypothetical protein
LLPSALLLSKILQRLDAQLHFRPYRSFQVVYELPSVRRKVRAHAHDRQIADLSAGIGELPLQQGFVD